MASDAAEKNFNFAEWMSGRAKAPGSEHQQWGRPSDAMSMTSQGSSFVTSQASGYIAQPPTRSPMAAPGAAAGASAAAAASGAVSPSSPSGLRAVRSSKLRFTAMEDAATRVRKYLTGELGQGVADVILQFDDDQCIYIAKHYMVAVSSVWDGLLNDVEQSGKKTSKSKDGTRQRVFLVPEKSFEDVLEFWCICYCSDDAVLTVTEANLHRMLELACEWKVFPMLHKCERLIVKMIGGLRTLPVWKALVEGSTFCGCTDGARKRGIEDCEECALPFHLQTLAWIAVISSENKLQKSWGAVLSAFRDLDIHNLTALIDEHPAFEDVGIEIRFAIMVHYITDRPEDAAAAAAALGPDALQQFQGAASAGMLRGAAAGQRP